MRFGAGEPEINLLTRLQSVDLVHLVSEEWNPKLKGQLNAEVEVSGRLGLNETRKVSGSFQLENGVVKDFQPLRTFGQAVSLGKAGRFDPLVLHQAGGKFEVNDHGVVLREVALQSDGLTRLEGDLTFSGSTVAGDLLWGVTPGTFTGINRLAAEAVFTEKRDGFLWTEVSFPPTEQEELASVVSAICVQKIASLGPAAVRNAEEAIKALAGDVSEGALETTIDLLKNPAANPGSLMDEGKKALDTLLPLLPIR